MTTDSTSPAGIDLDAITKRARRVYPKRGWDGGEAERALPVVTEDVPALVAEVLRLRALRDDIADAFDGLVMKAWRATGETHEPPANVAALLARVAAARREGAEAMREECYREAREWSAAATDVGGEVDGRLARTIADLAGAVERGRGERWVEGTFGLHARHQGNGVGYDSICAAGDHANTLHWIKNTGEVRPGDLILLDAGVEVDSLYTADITRTLPVDGTFTDAQREIYDAVYAAQQAGTQHPGERSDRNDVLGQVRAPQVPES